MDETGPELCAVAGFGRVVLNFQVLLPVSQSVTFNYKILKSELITIVHNLTYQHITTILHSIFNIRLQLNIKIVKCISQHVLVPAVPPSGEHHL
jgi:hypothetical protein